jgi:hypothetical protein
VNEGLHSDSDCLNKQEVSSIRLRRVPEEFVRAVTLAVRVNLAENSRTVWWGDVAEQRAV